MEDNFWNIVQKLVNETTASNTTADDNNCLGHQAFQGNRDVTASDAARMIYAVAGLFVIVCGVFGNSLSLYVFATSRSRSRATTSCSYCLISLSLCDLLVVLTYCLVEWTQRGFGVLIGRPNYSPRIVDHVGICQVFLYVAYTLRLTSVWLLVLFTLERYIGVCHPLQKRRLCTPSRTRSVIIGVIIVNCLLCIYKPVLSNLDHATCGSASDIPRKGDLSFILDACYALLTSAIPFIVLLALNISIARALLARRHLHRSSGPDHMGLQFAVILVTVSSTFILLNLPYSIAWLLKWLQNRDRRQQLSTHSSVDLECLTNLKASFTSTRSSGLNLASILTITRTIFQFNYCINFFLYSMTGAFFRAELRRMIYGRRVVQEWSNQNNPELLLSSSRRLTMRTNCNTVKYYPQHST